MNWVFLDSGLTAKVGKNIPEGGNSIYSKQELWFIQEMNEVLG